METARRTVANLTVRPLREEEVALALSVVRRAFGTFVGMPDPEAFGAGADYVGPRWRADATRVFAAECEGRLAGISVANRWGSLGFFGPLAVSPEFWGQGIGQALTGAAMQQFAVWGNRHLGLFTFPHSTQHVHLYEKFGFYPRFLTAVMAKAVAADGHAAAGWSRYAALAEDERAGALHACRDVAGDVYPELDLTQEIEAVRNQGLGDTILLVDDARRIGGFAVCQHGAGTEAARGECYVKFAAVRPGAAADRQFTQLLSACEAFAADAGLARLIGGVNLACEAAYHRMCESGFRTDFLGVAMEQPNEPGYNRPDRHVISDWR
jgi:ribosomal protein S18 acetylase RimI-like enzyme